MNIRVQFAFEPVRIIIIAHNRTFDVISTLKRILPGAYRLICWKVGDLEKLRKLEIVVTICEEQFGLFITPSGFEVRQNSNLVYSYIN